MKRIGIAFSGGASPAEIVECVKLAEQLGYESAWVAEGHGGDQFAVLAACARETSRIGLGTAITSVFVRTASTTSMMPRPNCGSPVSAAGSAPASGSSAGSRPRC
jgi:alkanesulfonate monooxygenase SsuD/methylene tetrahydromethanopterin reductase-like flavin-dependent oxidoreductase (luciferase family)